MFRIDNKNDIDKNAPEATGVYKIYWLKNGKPQPIQRIVRTDESGLLYIGKTDGELKKRLNQFRLNAFGGSSNHSGGLKYKKLSVLNKMIAPIEMFATTTVCKNAKKQEKAELEDYKKKFGEVPPLNG